MEKTISIGIDSDYNLSIITKEEMLPVDICEKILNKVCKEVILISDRHSNKELRIWKLLSFVQSTILLLVILKVKGVL